MKNIRCKNVLFFIIFAFIIHNCREQKVKTVDDRNNSSSHDTALAINPRIINYDSLLTQILDLQNALVQNPEDTHSIRQLLVVSFDSLQNLFYCAGKGVVNTKHPAEAQLIGMRRAAQNTAQRWALYLKAWQENTMIPFGVEISGNVMSGTAVLFEKTSGDTVYQLVSISPEKIRLL